MKKLLFTVAMLAITTLIAQQPDSVAPVWDVTRPNAKTAVQMNAMTRMVEGSEVWRNDTKTIWRYVNGVWVDTGGGPESDPVFTAHPAFNVTSLGLSNAATAFSWGNHATAGYLTSGDVVTYTAASPITLTGNEFGLSIPATVTALEALTGSNRLNVSAVEFAFPKYNSFIGSGSLDTQLQDGIIFVNPVLVTEIPTGADSTSDRDILTVINFNSNEIISQKYIDVGNNKEFLRIKIGAAAFGAWVETTAAGGGEILTFGTGLTKTGTNVTLDNPFIPANYLRVDGTNSPTGDMDFAASGIGGLGFVQVNNLAGVGDRYVGTNSGGQLIAMPSGSPNTTFTTVNTSREIVDVDVAPNKIVKVTGTRTLTLGAGISTSNPFVIRAPFATDSVIVQPLSGYTLSGIYANGNTFSANTDGVTFKNYRSVWFIKDGTDFIVDGEVSLYDPPPVNQITGKAGFFGSPDATDITFFAATANVALNTNATFVRTGTTSLAISDLLNTTGNVLVRWQTPSAAPSGVTVTVSFYSKSASTVTTAIRGASPATTIETPQIGDNDWQYHEQTFVSDGGASQVYVYVNGNPTTNNIDVVTYVDDILITW